MPCCSGAASEMAEEDSQCQAPCASWQQPLSRRYATGGRKRKASDALHGAIGAGRKAKRGAALLASVRDSLVLAQLWLAGLYQVPPPLEGLLALGL